MPDAEVNGVSLFYEVKGAGEAILFCHGIPTDYRAWNAQVDDFSKRFRTVVYSRRYAFPNDRKGDLTDSTVENNAADLKALIERIGVGPVHLVGHSYGGFISAYLAADHPDLVRTLVLVEPAISTLLVENSNSVSQMFSLLLRSPSVALSARRFQNASLRPSLEALDSNQPERATELNVDGVQDMPGAFAAMTEDKKRAMTDNARTIAELRTRFPVFKPHIGKISCRTLVVNGADSALWLRRIGELTASSIPHSESFKVPAARHFPHIENASVFNKRVLEFVSKS